MNDSEINLVNGTCLVPWQSVFQQSIDKSVIETTHVDQICASVVLFDREESFVLFLSISYARIFSITLPSMCRCSKINKIKREEFTTTYGNIDRPLNDTHTASCLPVFFSNLLRATSTFYMKSSWKKMQLASCWLHVCLLRITNTNVRQ